MFGNFFEGQLCADSCVKMKGKIIPDCENLGKIRGVQWNMKFLVEGTEFLTTAKYEVKKRVWRLKS